MIQTQKVAYFSGQSNDQHSTRSQTKGSSTSTSTSINY